LPSDLDIAASRTQPAAARGRLAPVHQERSLDAPDMVVARAAVDAVLAGHDPLSRSCIDRHWTLNCCNRAVTSLLQGGAGVLAPL